MTTVIQTLVPLVDEFKKNPVGELEVLLGVVTDQFVSGVDFVYFKSLFESLNSSRLQSETVPRRFANFFFKDSIRGTYPGNTAPTFVKKTPHTTLTFGCPQRKYHVRFNFKLETPTELVVTRPPEYVRLIERWSFVHKETWRYDLSKVASGLSKEHACNAEPHYEIELELLRNPEFLQKDSVDIATHLYEKTLDLLGRFDNSNNTTDLTLNDTRM